MTQVTEGILLGELLTEDLEGGPRRGATSLDGVSYQVIITMVQTMVHRRSGRTDAVSQMANRWSWFDYSIGHIMMTDTADQLMALYSEIQAAMGQGRGLGLAQAEEAAVLHALLQPLLAHQHPTIMQLTSELLKEDITTVLDFILTYLKWTKAATLNGCFKFNCRRGSPLNASFCIG